MFANSWPPRWVIVDSPDAERAVINHYSSDFIMPYLRWMAGVVLLIATASVSAEEQLQPRATLHNAGDVTRIYFSPSGATVYVSGPEYVGHTWKTTLTGIHEPYETEKAKIAVSAEGCISSDLELAARADPEGKVIVTGPVRFLHALHPVDVQPKTDRRLFPLAMALSPDRRWLALGCINGSIELWEKDLRGVKDRRGGPTEATDVPHLQAPHGSVVGIEFTRDSGLLVAAVESTRTRPAPDADLRIQLWDPLEQKLIRRAAATGPGFHLSRGGQALAAWDDRGLTVVEMATGGKRCAIADKVTTAALSVDGRFLATGDPEDDTIRVRDLTGPESPIELKAHRHRLTALAFSPDGKMLASASDGTVHLWDLPTPRSSAKMTSDDLEVAWKELVNRDAERAYRSIATLSRAPAASVPFLTQKLKSAILIDQALADRLIAGLDDKDFEIREKSSREISKLGPWLRPRLEKALGEKPSLELTTRIRALLAEPEKSWFAIEPVPQEALQVIRAVEALKAAGTPGARKALEELAESSAAQRPAAAALDRLVGE